MNETGGVWVRDDLKWRIVGMAGKLAIDAIFATCRVKVLDPYGAAPLVFHGRAIAAFWHSRILLASYIHKGIGATIMVSASEDGEIIAQVLHRQGHFPVRGSSRKGGAKALAAVAARMSERPTLGVVIPDGPQGPRRLAQPGAVTLAAKTGRPIVAMAYSARDMFIFRSWDRFLLPRPGTHCTFVYGRPIFVEKDLSPAGMELKRREMQREIDRITDLADGLYGRRLP